MSVKARELAAAANCADQAVTSMRAAALQAGPPAIGLDNDVEHAVRMIRLAAYHAFKARPDLAPQNNYDVAVAEHRAQRDRVLPWRRRK